MSWVNSESARSKIEDTPQRGSHPFVNLGHDGTYTLGHDRQVLASRGTISPNRNRNRTLPGPTLAISFLTNALLTVTRSSAWEESLTYALASTPNDPRESFLELVKRDLAVVISVEILKRDEVVGVGSFEDYRASEPGASHVGSVQLTLETRDTSKKRHRLTRLEHLEILPRDPSLPPTIRDLEHCIIVHVHAVPIGPGRNGRLRRINKVAFRSRYQPSGDL